MVVLNSSDEALVEAFQSFDDYCIPVIDMLKHDESMSVMVRACKEVGFFKVINHGVPVELMAALEGEAINFFSMNHKEKEKMGGVPNLCYGSKNIGPNGDVGWVEYLLMKITTTTFSSASVNALNNNCFSRCGLNDYVKAMRKLSCQVLEMMAQGLGLEVKDVFSRMVTEEDSDTMFRVNHYPPCPHVEGDGVECSVTGFGEHTDPQLISILRANNTSGLQIALKDGTWVTVPSDNTSFFVTVGDSLQVMTNGRFKSARHRVLANSLHSRLSMIYFGGPPSREKIVALPVMMEEGEESNYREFTWCEYKMSACKSRLGDDRLALFHK